MIKNLGIFNEFPPSICKGGLLKMKIFTIAILLFSCFAAAATITQESNPDPIISFDNTIMPQRGFQKLLALICYRYIVCLRKSSKNTSLELEKIPSKLMHDYYYSKNVASLRNYFSSAQNQIILDAALAYLSALKPSYQRALNDLFAGAVSVNLKKQLLPSRPHLDWKRIYSTKSLSFLSIDSSFFGIVDVFLPNALLIDVVEIDFSFLSYPHYNSFLFKMKAFLIKNNILSFRAVISASNADSLFYRRLAKFKASSYGFSISNLVLKDFQQTERAVHSFLKKNRYSIKTLSLINVDLPAEYFACLEEVERFYVENSSFPFDLIESFPSTSSFAFTASFDPSLKDILQNLLKGCTKYQAELLDSALSVIIVTDKEEYQMNDLKQILMHANPRSISAVGSVLDENPLTLMDKSISTHGLLLLKELYSHEFIDCLIRISNKAAFKYLYTIMDADLINITFTSFCNYYLAFDTIPALIFYLKLEFADSFFLPLFYERFKEFSVEIIANSKKLNVSPLIMPDLKMNLHFRESSVEIFKSLFEKNAEISISFSDIPWILQVIPLNGFCLSKITIEMDDPFSQTRNDSIHYFYKFMTTLGSASVILKFLDLPYNPNYSEDFIKACSYFKGDLSVELFSDHISKVSPFIQSLKIKVLRFAHSCFDDIITNLFPIFLTELIESVSVVDEEFNSPPMPPKSMPNLFMNSYAETVNSTLIIPLLSMTEAAPSMSDFSRRIKQSLYPIVPYFNWDLLFVNKRIPYLRVDRELCHRILKLISAGTSIGLLKIHVDKGHRFLFDLSKLTSSFKIDSISLHLEDELEMTSLDWTVLAAITSFSCLVFENIHSPLSFQHILQIMTNNVGTLRSLSFVNCTVVPSISAFLISHETQLSRLFVSNCKSFPPNFIAFMTSIAWVSVESNSWNTSQFISHHSSCYPWMTRYRTFEMNAETRNNFWLLPAATSFVATSYEALNNSSPPTCFGFEERFSPSQFVLNSLIIMKRIAAEILDLKKMTFEEYKKVFSLLNFDDLPIAHEDLFEYFFIYCFEQFQAMKK